MDGMAPVGCRCCRPLLNDLRHRLVICHLPRHGHRLVRHAPAFDRLRRQSCPQHEPVARRIARCHANRKRIISKPQVRFDNSFRPHRPDRGCGERGRRGQKLAAALPRLKCLIDIAHRLVPWSVATVSAATMTVWALAGGRVSNSCWKPPTTLLRVIGSEGSVTTPSGQLKPSTKVHGAFPSGAVSCSLCHARACFSRQS